VQRVYDGTNEIIKEIVGQSLGRERAVMSLEPG
jgi:hypothetical protein